MQIIRQILAQLCCLVGELGINNRDLPHAYWLAYRQVVLGGTGGTYWYGLRQDMLYLRQDISRLSERECLNLKMIVCISLGVVKLLKKCSRRGFSLTRGTQPPVRIS